MNVDTATGKASVKALSDEVKGLKTQADLATPALKATSGATLDTGQKAMQAKGAVAALGAAMGLISPQAQQLVMAAGNLSGALGGVSKAAGLAGASLAAGGILAVAVGALAVIWKVLADNVKEAEDRMKDAAKTATQMQGISDKVRGARLSADLATGKITNSQYQFERATIQGQETFNPQIAQAQTELDAIPKTYATSQQRALKQKQIENLNNAMANYIDDLFTGATESVKTEAPKAAAKAKASVKKSAEASTFSFGGGPDVFGGQDPFASSFSFGPSDPFGGADPYAQQRPTSVTGLPPPPRTGPQPGMQAIGAYGTAVGNLAGGNAGAALGMIPGPAGAIAGTLSAIGTGGAKGVDKSLTGLKDAFIGALHALPEILTEIIPEFIESFISEVIPALIKDLPAIIKAAVIDIPIAIVKGIWDAIKSIIPNKTPGGGGFLGIGDKNSGFFGIGNERGRGEGGMHGLFGIHGLFEGQSYDTGSARITSDQIAMIHKNEAVLTPSQADQWRKTGGMAAGTPSTEIHHHYEINGPVGDSAFASIIEAQISKRFGPGGVGYSTGLTGGLRG